MERIDGVGTVFHYALGGTPDKAVVALYAFDTRGASDYPRDGEALAAYVAHRAGDLPVLHRRIVRTPLGLGNPVWVDDPGAGVRVYARRVGGTGSWSDVGDTLMGLAAEPDAGAVPFEVFLLEGVDAEPQLPPDALVVALRLDHAALDGTARVALERALFPAEPADWHGPALRYTPRGAPSRVSMLASAVASLPGRVGASARMLAQARRLDKENSGPRPVRPTPPATVVDAVENGGHPVFIGTTVPMAQVRAGRAALAGATVNDVVLAAVAGALRGYLAEFGSVPAEPLVCQIPVALRSGSSGGGGGAGRTHGNDITRTTVPLPAAEADPLRRLHLVHEAALAAKEQVAKGPQVLLEKAFTTLSAPLSAKLLVWASPKTDPVNVAVTNVARGSKPLHLGDAPAVRTHVISMLHPGAPLTHQVTNLGDTMMVSVGGGRCTLADPDRYRQLLEEAFAELAGLAGGR